METTPPHGLSLPLTRKKSCGVAHMFFRHRQSAYVAGRNPMTADAGSSCAIGRTFPQAQVRQSTKSADAPGEMLIFAQIGTSFVSWRLI